jgi:hypothetical protein
VVAVEGMVIVIVVIVLEVQAKRRWLSLFLVQGFMASILPSGPDLPALIYVASSTSLLVPSAFSPPCTNLVHADQTMAESSV